MLVDSKTSGAGSGANQPPLDDKRERLAVANGHGKGEADDVVLILVGVVAARVGSPVLVDLGAELISASRSHVLKQAVHGGIGGVHHCEDHGNPFDQVFTLDIPDHPAEPTCGVLEIPMGAHAYRQLPYRYGTQSTVSWQAGRP